MDKKTTENKDAKNKTPNFEITKIDLPNSQTKLECKLEWNDFQEFENDAVSKLISKVELKGFRKGSVPADIARKQIPDEAILADMSELAINAIYQQILSGNKYDVIGRPEVMIQKIARGNPLEFSITITLLPEIKLPDYRSLASKITLSEPKEINENDIDKVVEDLRQMRAYGHVHGPNDNHEHGELLPEVDDEFAKSFGKFETVAQLRAKIKENLTIEATQAAKDKRRIEIMESIVVNTSFELPEIITNSEIQKMIAQIEADVARSGATLEEYLTHIKKTKEELVEEFRPEAMKRARFQLVLNAIAKEADLLPSDKEIEAESQRYMEMYPGADSERTKAYAEMMLTNEKALSHLESK